MKWCYACSSCLSFKDFGEYWCKTIGDHFSSPQWLPRQSPVLLYIAIQSLQMIPVVRPATGKPFPLMDWQCIIQSCVA